MLVNERVFEAAPGLPDAVVTDTKTACVTFVRQRGHPALQVVGVASVHLRFGEAQQNQSMLRSVVAALDRAGPAAGAVLAGDFNADVGTPLFVAADDFLRAEGFVRLCLAEGQVAPTALTATFVYSPSKTIDFVYVRRLAAVAPLQVGPLPEGGRGPYGPDAVDLDGSDHAWLLATLAQPV